MFCVGVRGTISDEACETPLLCYLHIINGGCVSVRDLPKERTKWVGVGGCLWFGWASPLALV
jgi:hypothetical protein